MSTETFDRYIFLYSSYVAPASRFDLVDINPSNGGVHRHIYFSASYFDFTYGSLSLMHNQCYYLFMYFTTTTPGIVFYYYDINLGAPVITSGYPLYRITGTANMRLEMAQSYLTDFIALAVYDTVNQKNILMMITANAGVNTVLWMKTYY